MNNRILYLSALVAVTATTLVACSDKKNPTTPTPPPVVSATLTAPKLDSPALNEQLGTLEIPFVFDSLAKGTEIVSRASATGMRP